MWVAHRFNKSLVNQTQKTSRNQENMAAWYSLGHAPDNSCVSISTPLLCMDNSQLCLGVCLVLQIWGAGQQSEAEPRSHFTLLAYCKLTTCIRLQYGEIGSSSQNIHSRGWLQIKRVSRSCGAKTQNENYVCKHKKNGDGRSKQDNSWSACAFVFPGKKKYRK